jgi:hypothetical protein
MRGAFIAAALGAALAAPTQAQMFHLYLDCKGAVAAGTEKIMRSAGLSEKEEESSRQTGGEKTEDRSDANSRIGSTGFSTRAAKADQAYIFLAMRDNNMTALVQRSNVLPVGERMRYQATQSHYTATYEPQRTGRAFAEFRGTWLFTWHPPFEKLVGTRVSIDRQTGELEGEMVAAGGDVLGRIAMTCTPRKDGEGPAPRF